MKIKFCGASKMVTGSCTLIETGNRKILVDCGMFQGSDRGLNTGEFPFNPAHIDFVIQTHAHIDHCGRLPLLVKQGFKGSIYCTSATAELLGIMLKDSAHIQEMDAKFENKKRVRRGLTPIEPLYTIEDAEYVPAFVYTVSYNKTVAIDDNIRLTLRDAGHLLGSAIVVLEITEGGKTRTITFTGDLGNSNIPILKDYEYVDRTDYLVVESTYGNRLHEIPRETQNLCDVITRTTERGGNVIIPSFSVGRAQEVLYLLNYYVDDKKIDRLRNTEIYLDSPLAVNALEIFGRHMECYDEDAIALLSKGDSPLDFSNLHIVRNTADSMALNGKNGVVIISSSGMCEAGRIKHHLKHNIWRKDSSVVFVGYQAQGTLGRRILDGDTFVRIFGEKMLVRAEIVNIPGMSGHADQNGILNWLGRIKHISANGIFINHGDPEASDTLKSRIEEMYGLKPAIPDLYGEYELA